MKTEARDYSPEPVTRRFIGAAVEAHDVLDYGFLERVRQRAMPVELELRGVKSELEPKNKVPVKGAVVGDCAADLLVEGGSSSNYGLTRLLHPLMKRSCSTNSAGQESAPAT